MEKEFKKEWLDVEILDGFQTELLAFTYRKKRAPSVQEMRWLRMLHKMRSIARPREVVAMAAAKDGFNESIERAASDTQVFSFATAGNAYRVTIEVTKIPDELPEVAIKMADHEGNGVPHGRVIFPGTDISIETDESGWQVIPYEDYDRYVQSVMRLQCSISSSEPIDLNME